MLDDSDNDDENSIKNKETAPVLLPLGGTLLTHRDVRMEAYLQEVLEEVTQRCPAPADASTDEITRLWTRQLASRVSSKSAILWNRVSPVAAILISQKLREAHEKTMVSLVRTTEPLPVMARKYKLLFDAWIDASHCVSFATGNKPALGGLSPKDYWILQFFVLGTCERARTDNLLQIGVVGRTTVGKSTLFEAPLTGSAHYYVRDAGVGRFKVDDKTILFFHDVDINDLCFGIDRDLVKTLARGEATQAKVHGSTVAVPSMHLFYSSNTKMFTHHQVQMQQMQQQKLQQSLFPLPLSPHLAPKRSKVDTTQFINKTFKADIAVVHANNPNHMLHLDAMRYRFLECFCSEKPPIDTSLLPRNGSFHRNHMVLGIYERVMDLLENVYKPCHFKEMPALAEYVITGLAKRARLAYDHLFVPTPPVAVAEATTTEKSSEEMGEKENEPTKMPTAPDIELFLQRIVKLSIDYVSENSYQQHEFILNLLHKNVEM